MGNEKKNALLDLQAEGFFLWKLSYHLQVRREKGTLIIENGVQKKGIWKGKGKVKR